MSTTSTTPTGTEPQRAGAWWRALGPNGRRAFGGAFGGYALDAYEDAGLRGLCAEGRWECALEAIRSLALTPSADRSPLRSSPAVSASRRWRVRTLDLKEDHSNDRADRDPERRNDPGAAYARRAPHRRPLAELEHRLDILQPGDRGAAGDLRRWRCRRGPGRDRGCAARLAHQLLVT